MITRKLGNTDLQVSILGFGASPLGGVFGAITDEEAKLMVHTAVDRGINLFDVSPFYGVTRAETVLGKSLQGIQRDRYVLATKVGRYDAALFDFSAKRTILSANESLARLKTDYIDLIQCHDIEFGSLDQVVNETIPALRSLRDQGKVRFIGITGLPLKIFPYVLDRTEVDTVLSYCHYTLYDDSLSSLLPNLTTRGVGVISAAPLGMGLLTYSGPPNWHPAPETLRAACTRTAQMCRERGSDVSQLGLQFALSNNHICSTLIGIGSLQQLENNLACVGVEPDTDLLRAVSDCFAAVHNMTWQSGLPENN
jgi:L-galactose dehydrogenase